MANIVTSGCWCLGCGDHDLDEPIKAEIADEFLSKMENQAGFDKEDQVIFAVQITPKEETLTLPKPCTDECKDADENNVTFDELQSFRTLDVIKYSRKGQKHQRTLRISSDGKTFCWTEDGTKTFGIDALIEVRKGSVEALSENKATRSMTNEEKKTCLQLIFPHRTLELWCKTDQELNQVFQIFQALQKEHSLYVRS
mmetsp:Transcript_24588/g.31966  ORF Transcript_24588/g.31966 Transcript_24588/m.31966 type:complete len:198 (+) Transcript_24588:116-709(+)